MNIQQESAGHYGRFFFEQDGAEGELTYRLNNSVLALDHTGVDERLSGQGVGTALVERAVEWAREKGYRVKPHCSFAAKLMHSDASYADVLISANDATAG